MRRAVVVRDGVPRMMTCARQAGVRVSGPRQATRAAPIAAGTPSAAARCVAVTCHGGRRWSLLLCGRCWSLLHIMSAGGYGWYCWLGTGHVWSYVVIAGSAPVVSPIRHGLSYLLVFGHQLQLAANCHCWPASVVVGCLLAVAVAGSCWSWL